MTGACEAWCVGIEGLLQMFGDNLPTDSGILAKICKIVQETVTAVCFITLQQYVHTALYKC